MKSLIITISSFLSIISSLHAQNFYSFDYMGKSGLTNDSATELVPPLYTYSMYIEAQNLWVFQPPINFDGEDMPTCTFNENTGEKNYYEAFRINEVTIGDETYSRVKENQKQFLRSEVSDKTIPLKAEYNFPSFTNIGRRYIICSYTGHIKTKPVVPVSKSKTSVPELRDSIVTYTDILANNDSIPVLLSGLYTACRPLYDENSFVYEEYPELAGLLCSEGNTHTLYDATLKKIATFTKVLPEDIEIQDPENKALIAVLTRCSDLLKTKVIFDFPRKMAINLDGTETDGPADPQPYLSTSAMDGGEYLIINYPDGQKRTVLYTKHAIEADKYSNRVTVREQGSGKSTAYFYVDTDTAKVMFPEKYANALGITIY